MEESKNTPRRIRKTVINDMIIEHGKIPPQAIDLEEIVIGSCLLDARAYDEISNVLSPEIFYKTEHQLIFAAIQSMSLKNKKADIVTITNYLRQSGELDMVGGPYFIASTTDRVGTSANIKEHAYIILQKHIQRELIRVSSDCIKDAYEDTTDVFDLLDNTDNAITKIRELQGSGETMRHISVIGDEAGKEAKRRQELAKKGGLVGIRCGILDMDKVTNGWQNSDLIILASRPNMGKTASMLKFAKEAAMTGVPVNIFSLEMRDVRLHDRMTLSETNISIDRFRGGYMSDEEWQEYYTAKAMIAQLPIYIDPKPAVNPAYIRTVAKLMKKKGKCGLILADHLHLATSGDKTIKNREQEVSFISRQCKNVAKELEVPFILLAQLNRESERRNSKDHRPMMSDLRDSGGIEENADQIIFIYRPAYYNILQDEAGNSLEGIGEYIIAKNRDGSVKTIPFRHNEPMTKIFDFITESELKSYF